MDILFVCTANQCRSPMAEAMLRARLAGRDDAQVHSAGLLEGGLPATAETMAAATGRNVDLSAHESRKLTAELISGADLVLGLARRHVVEAVVMAPEAWTRTFTLKELVRRGESVGPRSADQPLADWLAKAGAARTRADLLGESPEDDVADPVTQPDETTYEAAAAEIEGLVDRLVALVWGRG